MLVDKFDKGFKYYDLQVDDKKLTELNTYDAKKNGVTIIEDDEVVSVERFKNHWQVLSKKNELFLQKF